MRKSSNVKWFQFILSKEVILPMVLGSLAILVSVLMNVTESQIIKWVLRSICQMGIIGVIIPLWVLYKKGELKKAGIKWEKPVKMFLISTILGAITAMQFIGMANGHVNNLFSATYIQATIYVMIANIFEIVFFFAFMRYYFEKSFGVIPAIILTSLFYSFHHAGFEPEFLKLFIVGVVFIGIFRIANNVLICFPLWWVGGLGDVLASKESFDSSRMTILGILPVVICFIIIIIWMIFKEHNKRNLINNKEQSFDIKGGQTV